VLHRYAQQASPRQLGAEMGVGLVVASVAVWVRPASWIVLLCIGCALSMLGVWAWADRAVEHSTIGVSRSWRIVRLLAAVVGVTAAALTAFAGLAKVLGTWIS
jgi:hypothetical protein